MALEPNDQNTCNCAESSSLVLSKKRSPLIRLSEYTELSSLKQFAFLTTKANDGHRLANANSSTYSRPMLENVAGFNSEECVSISVTQIRSSPFVVPTRAPIEGDWV
jgi:hypothetical protein